MYHFMRHSHSLIINLLSNAEGKRTSGFISSNLSMLLRAEETRGGEKEKYDKGSGLHR